MAQPTLAQLGSTIRELRVQRSLTIEALAAEAKLHPVSISRIEAGKQNLTWAALGGICRALDVEILELVRLALRKEPGPAPD